MQKRMDWRSVNFDWNRARAFLVTAEEGSLSAAARALGMTQPTLGRQVDALEQELGLVLFERTGRGLTLTPSGTELLDHVRAMGEAANRVSLSATGQSQSVVGTVSIACSDTYGEHLLPPFLKRIRAEQPGIRIQVVTSNQASDLRRREADIAIRNFRPTEPDLIAKKIRDVEARLYATPAYLDEIGTPKTPYDLRKATFIDIATDDGYQQALKAWGFDLAKDNFPLQTSSFPTMWAMVRAGLGIGVIDSLVGDNDPLTTRVLPDHPPLPFPTWLVAHREVTTSRRIRLVFDILGEEIEKAYR